MPRYLQLRLAPLTAIVAACLGQALLPLCAAALTVELGRAELTTAPASRLESRLVAPTAGLRGFDPAAEWAAVSTGTSWIGARRSLGAPRTFGVPAALATTAAPPHPAIASAFTDATAETRFVAGQVALSANDLLFNGYRRPGAAANLRYGQQAQVTLFGAQADPAQRFYGSPALEDAPTEVSSGFRAMTRLAPQVELTTSYLSGETNFLTPEAVLFNEPRRYGGDGWNVALDSRWLEQSMRVQLEYAQSNFDRDGFGRGNPRLRDSASQLGFRLAPGPLLGKGPFDYWSTDLRYRHVGGDFFALANPMLATDQEALGSWLRFGRGGLAGQLQWLSEANNLAAQRDIPTRTLERSAVELTYTPTLPPSQAWLWDRIGAPALVTEMGRVVRTSSVPEGRLSINYHPADEADELRTVVRFTRPSWRWSARYHVLDRAGLFDVAELPGGVLFTGPPDRRRELAGFKVGLTPNERLSLDLSLLWNTLSEQEGGVGTFDVDDRRHYGVDLTTAVVPDRLSLQLHYHHGRDFDTLGDFGLLSDRTLVNNGYMQLSWHALKAGAARPAVDVYLQGQYDERLNPINDDAWENWSVRLGMKLSWRER